MKEILPYTLQCTVLVVHKNHTVDITLPSEGTTLWKRLGMARVVEGFLPAHPRIYKRKK